MYKVINIIFDGPPGPEAGRFVEVETDDGKGIGIGEWVERPDGYWTLRISDPYTEIERLNKKIERLLDLIDALVEAADDDWSETVGKPIVQEAVAYLVGDKQ